MAIRSTRYNPFLLDARYILHYDYIDRRLLCKILDEHGFAKTGLVDEKSIQELGNILGVEGIIIGTVAKVDINYKVNLRLLDV